MPIKKGRVFVATETFITHVDGRQVNVVKGKTRVREGHVLLTKNPHLFKPAEDFVDFDVEDASADPGVKRGER